MMKTPVNRFKKAITEKHAQIGLWMGMAGILTSDVTQAKHYLSLGALFVAVGLDTQILVRQTSALVRQFKPEAGIALPTSGQVY